LLVVLVQRDQRGGDAEVRQQLAAAAGVLGADRRHLAQHLLPPRRKVAEVADGRGDDMQGSGGHHGSGKRRKGRILSPFRPAPPATRTDMPNPAPLKSPSLRLRLLAPGLAVLLAAGCATAPTTTSAPEYAAAIAQLEGGQPREAAGQLEAQAQAATGARRAALLADAAFAWREAGDEARARSLLSQVDARRVGGASKLRLALLNAELAVQDGRPAEAATALAGSDATTLSPALQS